MTVDATEIDPKNRSRTLSAKLHELRRLLGLDRAVVFTVLARGWSSMAGVATLLMIAHFLSSAEQGYYYTFGSLVAIQIVFELGFSIVILQMASHESAHLTLMPDGTVTGSLESHGRLASILQKSVQWYSIAAVLMFCTLIPVGLYFFTTHQQSGPAVTWKLAWVLVALASSVAFQIDPIFSFMEGCGYVPRVARTRFVQAILGSCLAWSALLLHHGLLAPALQITGQAVVGLGWLWTQRRLLLGLLRHTAGVNRIAWSTEVWPFQWRIAISWMCGYFISALFVPVLFVYRGPITAGQMGMSISVVGVLTSVAISWVNTKAAIFGAMIARRDYEALDRTFFRALAQSSAVCLALSLGAWSALSLINAYHIKLAGRMLAPVPFGLLLLTMVVNHTVFCIAVYLRSHKQEKMLVQSIFGAVTTSLSTYLLGRRFGPIGITGGYFAICVVGLGMAVFTFVHYRRVWHVEV